MSETAHSQCAVFISYASQDAVAAERICAALRAVGIEVWFDRTELRGGDAWDAQIRKQIHDCALFLPVISSHTDARIEGYFRREWNLATHRLLDMAHDAPFLLPVVIDETLETHARVPDEFLRAQWTRLPGGSAPPAFVERVRQLLSKRSGAINPASSMTMEPNGADGQAVHSPLTWPSRIGERGKRRLSALRLASIGLLLIIGAGAFWYWQGVPSVPKSEQAPVTPPPTSEAAINDKSIAVLPFADMSEHKDQDYFSDGISEELMNLLAKIPELRVIARTSSFSYKGKEVDIADIAKKLNVAYVLEGSVRKSGNKLRIAAQLIRTSDSTQLWSESFDRPLDDIFAVQDEIAGAVVDQLKIKLLSGVPKLRTVNAEAYALFLQALQSDRQYTYAGMEKALVLYQRALAIDPAYTAAWNGLAGVYSNQAWLGVGPRSADESFRLAREASKKALTTDPDYAPAHAHLGWIAMAYDDDLTTAARHLGHALALDPADPYVILIASELVSNLDHIRTAIELREYVADRDPVNPAGHGDLAYLYYVAGRLEDAIASSRSGLTLSPDSLGHHYRIGVSKLLKGDAPVALREMLAEPDEGWRLTGLALVYHALGERAESDAALAELIKKHQKSWSSSIAWVLAFRGEPDAAFTWMDKAVAYHDTGVVHFHIEPLLSSLHNDPRWLRFMRKRGKTPEQLAAIKFDVKLPK
jgi:TolB-like protein